MAFYSGKDGQLFIDGSQAAKVQSWSFSSSQAVLETTSLEDTDRTIVQGVRSYSGSARLFYYQASAAASESGCHSCNVDAADPVPILDINGVSVGEML